MYSSYKQQVSVSFTLCATKFIDNGLVSHYEISKQGLKVIQIEFAEN